MRMSAEPRTESWRRTRRVVFPTFLWFTSAVSRSRRHSGPPSLALNVCFSNFTIFIRLSAHERMQMRGYFQTDSKPIHEERNQPYTPLAQSTSSGLWFHRSFHHLIWCVDNDSNLITLDFCTTLWSLPAILKPTEVEGTSKNVLT